MKASELQPGQFFDWDDERWLCVRVTDIRCIAVDIDGHDYSIGLTDNVTLAVTGWDDEPPVAKPEPEQFAAGDWLYCIESHAPLVKGAVYEVLAVKRDGWPEVEEGQGYWNPKYFRRATPAEVVKHKIDNGYCLTDDDTAAFQKDYWQHPVVDSELTWTLTT